MCKLRSVLFLFAAFVLFVGHASALTTDQHRALQSAFDDTVKSVKATLAGAILTENAKIIFDSIRFEVRWFDGMIAYADVQEGRRTVVVSTGLLYVMENLKATEIHSGIMPGDSCYFDYQIYLFSELRKGDTSVGQLLSPEAVEREYCVCLTYSYQSLLKSQWKRAVTNGFSLSALFVILHEAAHHIKGDVQKKSGYDLKLELDADEWALETASKVGILLQPATGVFGLLLALEEGVSATSEERSTRFDRLIQRLIRLLEDKTLPRRLPDSVYEGAEKATREYDEWIRLVRFERRVLEPKVCSPGAPMNYDDIDMNTQHPGP